MPAVKKIRMNIGTLNNGDFRPPLPLVAKANSAGLQKPTPLSSSMIGRIHGVKAGCGGCGRHN